MLLRQNYNTAPLYPPLSLTSYNLCLNSLKNLSTPRERQHTAAPTDPDSHCHKYVSENQTKLRLLNRQKRYNHEHPKAHSTTPPRRPTYLSKLHGAHDRRRQPERLAGVTVRAEGIYTSTRRRKMF